MDEHKLSISASRAFSSYFFEIRVCVEIVPDVEEAKINLFHSQVHQTSLNTHNNMANNKQ